MMRKMCFSIPYKVLKIKNGKATVEGGREIKIGKELQVKKGDYLRIIGNIAVDTLSVEEGLKLRQLIKKLNN